MSKKSPSEQPPIPSPPQPGDVYEIPVEGSLGLLALGARGIQLWREKRDAAKKETASDKK